jgi:hypothetical protein
MAKNNRKLGQVALRLLRCTILLILFGGILGCADHNAKKEAMEKELAASFKKKTDAIKSSLPTDMKTPPDGWIVRLDVKLTTINVERTNSITSPYVAQMVVYGRWANIGNVHYTADFSFQDGAWTRTKLASYFDDPSSTRPPIPKELDDIIR